MVATQKNSMAVIVWAENRTGTKIVEFGMDFDSVPPAGKYRSFGGGWTRQSSIDREPTLIFREKYFLSDRSQDVQGPI